MGWTMWRDGGGCSESLRGREVDPSSSRVRARNARDLSQGQMAASEGVTKAPCSTGMHLTALHRAPIELGRDEKKPWASPGSGTQHLNHRSTWAHR